MQDLDVDQINLVSGGAWNFIGGYLAGKLLDYSIQYVDNAYDQFTASGREIEHSPVW